MRPLLALVSFRRGLVLAAGAAVAVSGLSVAACAESEPGTNGEPDAMHPLPGLEGEGGPEEAGVDGDADASPAPIDCSQIAFCPVAAPIPPLVTLNAIWGSSANDVWAVGTRGTILHGDGSTFQVVPSGTDEIFYGVWGRGPGDVWVTSSRVPRHARDEVDGGVSWDIVTGSTWNEWAQNFGRVWSIWGSSAEDVWLVGTASQRFGEPGSIWTKTTIFSGETVWQTVPAEDAHGWSIQPSLRALWGSSRDDIWAVGYGGQAFTYRPASGTWVQHNSRTSADLTAVWGAGRGDVWAVGQDGTIRHHTSASDSFHFVESPTKANLYAIWGSGPSDIWAVGEHGIAVHYDGTTWKVVVLELGIDPLPNLYGIWGSGPDDVWVVGDDVLLHRTKNSRREL